jgi:MGT family glycosyltransferase
MKNQSNVLFITIDGGGNLPPVLGLAKRLAKAGHIIWVLSEPCMEELILSMNFNYLPFNNYFTRKDRTEDIFKDAKVSNMKAPVLDNIVFGPAQLVVEESMEAIRISQADMLVADCLLPTAISAAEACRIPGILAFHMPEYLPGSNRPPGMFGLKPGKGVLGRSRDRILSRLFHMKIDKFLPRINATRRELNLPDLKHSGDLFHQADLRLMQTLESFDFPISPLPANVRYTGPVLDDPDWTGTWTNPWPADDPRPLVVISLSSTFQDQHQVIRNAMDALRGQEIRGLVTLGPALKLADFRTPENVITICSAPHSQVFPLADLVITHAGHGTLMRALANGLPTICLPMGRDQNDNAVKIVHHGCGIQLSPKSRPEKIQKAIKLILSEQRFHAAVKSFQLELNSLSRQDEIPLELASLLQPVKENSWSHQRAAV